MVSSVDVAKLAGVSQATVSRVLNTPEKVNAPTIEKVNAAIQQLNYRPNAAARSLISRKSGIIAVLCGPLSDPDNAEFAEKTIYYLKDKGYTAEIHLQDPDKPEAIFSSILTTQAEGMLCGPLLMTGTESGFLNSTAIPLVYCGIAPQEGGNTVTMDNRAAGTAAAEYIDQLGHKTVAWLGGETTDSRLLERYEGFYESMKGNGSEIIKSMTAKTDLDVSLTTMMARRTRPTAIIAATDDLGAHAKDFLMDFGYSIPDDITLLGIGNSYLSSMRYLNLSSIGLPEHIDLYRQAVDCLLEVIEQGAAADSNKNSFQPMLYERESSKAV